MFNLDVVGEDRTKTLIEMWGSCYDGDEDGWVDMLKDWLAYHQDCENYVMCSTIQSFMEKNGYDFNLENHKRRTYDMMALYEVCKEIVEMDNAYHDGI